jgi:dihydroorotase
MTNELTIRQPDDWHLHLRDGDMLKAVVGVSAQHFNRAIIMPNLVPPVVTEADAAAYRQRIMDAVNDDNASAQFTPLLTLYLTEQTDPNDVVSAAKNGVIQAVKLYPAGATTNSASGVKSIDKVMPVLEKMAENNIVLCMHGEVTNHDVDIFDREHAFIDNVLSPLRQRLPELRIVLEHVTTADGVEFVQSQNENMAATITPHHLLLNRNHMLVGGIRPHYYCLPIIKRETHRQSLVHAATSGDSRFFLGTDSAPHTANTKESACGCAGVFNAPNTLSVVAHVFEAASALDKLERFVSLNGPAFYGLPVNEARIQLVKKSEPVKYPEKIQVGEETVVVFDPGEPLFWHVVG